jgi:hypothetical protein
LDRFRHFWADSAIAHAALALASAMVTVSPSSSQFLPATFARDVMLLA